MEALVPGEHRQGPQVNFAMDGAGGTANEPTPARRLELQVARSKDGAELHVELTLTAIENAPVGGRYVLALARDVTARVRTRVREAAALRVAGQSGRTPAPSACWMICWKKRSRLSAETRPPSTAGTTPPGGWWSYATR